MPPFDPRKLMEQAVAVMRDSVAEPRTDGQAPPKVGVVLWKPDGSVDAACRGELRDGDHAEYTVLERKNGHQRLDGAVLFTTLEPCAPGSRRHPKLGCAERIALARIKEVWVGIEDPDPRVDRKGIKYLQDSGVTVNMFDRDLQETIREENVVFVGQALERAAAARAPVPPAPIVLSPLELATQVDFKQLSLDALRAYRTIAKIAEPVSSAEFRERLEAQGLLEKVKGEFAPTGYGVLLFGKEPRLRMPQAGLLGTIHHQEGTEELRDFDGPQVLVPSQAEQWLREKLPAPIDRSAARRKQKSAAVFELVREGIVNALVHRDYDIRGAKCQLEVTADTIVVRSPGAPVEPLTVEQVQSFEAPMLSRNPVLHHVFASMEMAEERGLGLKSMREKAVAAGLPLPKYAWQAPYLVLTIYRSEEAATRALGAKLLQALSDEEREGWSFIAARPSVTQREYAAHLGVKPRTAQRQLAHFVELGMLERQGKGPVTRYVVAKR